MNRIFSILICFCAFVSGYGQSALQQAQTVRLNEQKYVYGEGFGDTYSEADNNALQNLISKLATTLSSSFENVIDQVQTSPNDLEFKSAVRIVLNSYSQATLTNTRSLNLEDADNFHVMRYITQEDLAEIFKHREEKIGDMIRSAQRAEKKLKIDDALRYYYWAYTLMRSMQYPDRLTYDDNGETRLLSHWLPERINGIFSRLQVKLAEVK